MGEALAEFRHMPMLILRSPAAADRLNCCYPGDQGSNFATPGCPVGGGPHCVPGCSTRALIGASLERCLAQTRGRYNEVVLDTWRDGGWGRGAALGRMISALAIHARASPATSALARQVQLAAWSDGLALPLLEYKPDRAAAPFSVLRAQPADAGGEV